MAFCSFDIYFDALLGGEARSPFLSKMLLVEFLSSIFNINDLIVSSSRSVIKLLVFSYAEVFLSVLL